MWSNEIRVRLTELLVRGGISRERQMIKRDRVYKERDRERDKEKEAKKVKDKNIEEDKELK